MPSRETLQKTAQTLRKLATENRDLRSENEKLAADKEKTELAEEIVSMKIAASLIKDADFIDERSKLMSRPVEELQSIKLAASEMGPSFLSSVRDPEPSKSPDQSTKIASEHGVPAHILASRQTLVDHQEAYAN